LFTETRRCIDQSIRINIIGRRDRLDDSLLRAIEQSERMSADCARMHLRIAVDYSAQQSIIAAARRMRRSQALTPQDFHRLLDEVNHSSCQAGDVDLLIRTGGEKRLSDFLLWESAYAELHFTDCLWPDFDESHFQSALEEYAGRARRFGKVNTESG
jgi:undecaprenyl diphosphate synthase